MKQKILLAKMILLSAGLGLLGCAAMQGLPQGSVLTGDYEGPFDGKFFWGSIEIKVYETPGGARLVFGRLNQEAQERIRSAALGAVHTALALTVLA